MVSEAWGSSQGGVQDDRLQASQDFHWFIEQVTKARPTGDEDKAKALLADEFKQCERKIYRHAGVADRCDLHEGRESRRSALRSAYFEDLNDIGQAYEMPKLQATDHYQASVPGWNSGVPVSQTANAGVLL